jgi:PAS domain S-box-containing protein
LRILYLEDSPTDAELIQATLESEGIVCELTRTDTEADFVSLLRRGEFDLILADYTLPSFDGISALKLVKEVCPEIPFLFVSGTLGEEVAIEALKLGATDYVFKTRLTRIAPAIRRALSEAEERVQRKSVEEALRQSEAYLAEAQRLSQTGSWAWNPATGEIRYWSEECYRVLGFDPRDPLPRFEEFLQRLHPEDRAGTRERFEKAVREKADFELDYRVVHPAKGIRAVHAVGRAVLSLRGELVEFVGTVIDVTEHRRAEQELQQLVDFVPQYIVVLDTHGNVILANHWAREYTGLTVDEFRSLEIVDALFHPEDAKKVGTVRERGLAGTEAFEFDARLRGKDGSYRWFLCRYKPLIENGSVMRWYATATEIESRKQEEERVRKQNLQLEERTRIAQELHDTLLQTFVSASMQLGVALDSLNCDSLIKARLDRVLALMNQGIEEGRNTLQALRSSDFRTMDLVHALSRVQQELAVHPDIDFRVVVNGQQRPLQPTVRQETYRIGREALVNAFCHSLAKCVEFELEYAEDDLRMRVRDNGCGIDPQLLRAGREGHWGLAGMRERAATIGGVLEIRSSVDVGTEIELCIPSRIAFEMSGADRHLVNDAL